jgi:hypothetical protein
VLVVLSCGSLRLDCGNEVTVGCAGGRPVNPLKLGYTLSTLNFRTCDHEDTLRLLFSFSFSNFFFGDCKFYNVLFIEFLRLSTKVEEVSDWNIYLNEGSYLALNIVMLDQFPRPIR